MKTLIAYSSVDGHAKKIALHAVTFFRPADLDYEVLDLHQVRCVNVDVYQAVLVVAAVRYGHFNRRVKQFARQNHLALNNKLTVFLGVCLIARKPEKRLPQNNVYIRRFLQQTQWQPNLCEAVAGALRYPQYGWFDRKIIWLIMHLTGGETDQRKEIVYTDWTQVERLAKTFLAQAIQSSHPSA